MNKEMSEEELESVPWGAFFRTGSYGTKREADLALKRLDEKYPQHPFNVGVDKELGGRWVLLGFVAFECDDPTPAQEAA